MRRRQVVQQHPVGDLACEAQHALVEGADHDLGPPLAETNAEAEAGHPVEVAFEVDGLAAEAGAQESDELANLGEGALAVAGAVPATGHNR